MGLFPIDLVYTWVDGNDYHHARERSKYIRKTQSLHSEAHCVGRYRASGELQASIQSALTFMPWLHRIYIVVADGQTPKHLPSDPRIMMVDHSIMYDTFGAHLPTFNSHSIEAHLFRIPGLSDQFIYANDDTFFGQPLTPHTFFLPDGKPKVFMTTIHLKPGIPTRSTPPYQSAQMNTSILLQRAFGRKRRKRLLHQARAITKSLYEYAWGHSMFQYSLMNSSASRFRSKSDIEPVGLILNMGLETRKAVRGTVSSFYTTITDHTNLPLLWNRIKQAVQLYCINDVMHNPTRIHLDTYRQGLQTLLPHHRDQTMSLELRVVNEGNAHEHLREQNRRLKKYRRRKVL